MHKVADALFGPSQTSPLRVLVTGGCGNIGHNILSYLIECRDAAKSQRELTLVSLDVAVLEPSRALELVTYIKGSVANEDDVEKAFEALGDPRLKEKEIRIVFHVASVIDLSPLWLANDNCARVNVEGTRLMLKMTERYGIDAFVYTSTLDVTWDWKTKHNTIETYDYPKDPAAIYLKTKGIAESMVLKTNGTQISSKKTLFTAACRPVHVTGPGDMMVEAAMNLAEKSNVIIQWPSPSIHVVFVKNCAHGHVLAAIGLLKNPAVVGGRAFLIRDDHVSSYSKLALECSKRRVPSAHVVYLPYFLFFLIGYLSLFWAILERKVFRVSRPSPYTFGPLQVAMTTTSELFDNSASVRDLGYSQIVSIEEAKRVLEKWIDSASSVSTHNYFKPT